MTVDYRGLLYWLAATAFAVLAVLLTSFTLCLSSQSMLWAAPIIAVPLLSGVILSVPLDPHRWFIALNAIGVVVMFAAMVTWLVFLQLAISTTSLSPIVSIPFVLAVIAIIFAVFSFVHQSVDAKPAGLWSVA